MLRHRVFTKNSQFGEIADYGKNPGMPKSLPFQASLPTAAEKCLGTQTTLLVPRVITVDRVQTDPLFNFAPLDELIWDEPNFWVVGVIAD